MSDQPVGYEMFLKIMHNVAVKASEVGLEYTRPQLEAVVIEALRSYMNYKGELYGQQQE